MNLLSEQDAGGNLTAKYANGYTPIDGIGSMVQTEKRETNSTYYQYPCFDQRGSVYKLVDAAGVVKAEYEYNAFGVRLHAVNGGASNRLQYQSNWLTLKDSDGGLYLSPTRIYGATTGVFFSRDPLFKSQHLGIERMDGTNLFSGHFATRLTTDPSGMLSPWPGSNGTGNPVAGEFRPGGPIMRIPTGPDSDASPSWLERRLDRLLRDFSWYIPSFGGSLEGWLPDWIQGREGIIPDYLQGEEGLFPDYYQHAILTVVRGFTELGRIRAELEGRRLQLQNYQHTADHHIYEARHCIMSCEMSDEFGRFNMRLAGLINEVQGFVIWDIPRLRARLRGISEWAFQWSDFAENELGLSCAEQGLPCVDCCLCEFP